MNLSTDTRSIQGFSRSQSATLQPFGGFFQSNVSEVALVININLINVNVRVNDAWITSPPLWTMFLVLFFFASAFVEENM